MVLSALLPLLFVAIGLTVLLAKQDRERMEAGLLESTRLLSDALDAELRRSVSALQALARSDVLRQGDLQRFYAQAQGVKQDVALWDNIILLSPARFPRRSLPDDAYSWQTICETRRRALPAFFGCGATRFLQPSTGKRLSNPRRACGQTS